ncbi:MAG: iron ABC transporter permease [Chloroflexi bacterium]|nr:iron ABC transporter permease [Chloroflexota bacterium]
MQSSPFRKLKRYYRDNFLFVIIAVPLFFAVVVPLFMLVLNSFRDVSIGQLGFDFSRLTFKNYATAYLSARTWKILWDSLIFALGSTMVSFLIGGIAAFLTERTDAPFRGFMYPIMFIPLVIPGMLQAVAWALLLSPKIGLINKVWFAMGFERPLLSAYSMLVMLWVEGIILAPLTFIMLGAVLKRMDPSLEEAATTCGASWFTSARCVTSKLLLPAIAGIALLQFVRALEALEVPLVLGLGGNIRIFSASILVSVHQSWPPDYGLAFAFSMTLIVLTVLGLIFYQRIVKQAERFTVVTGKGYRPKTIKLGNMKPFAIVFQVFILVSTIALPLFILIWASLLKNYEIPSLDALSKLTFMNYGATIFRPDFMGMVKNTTILSTIVSVAVMLLALLLSWVILHKKIRGSSIIDSLSFIPYAIPSLAMGIAFMILFLSFRNPIYGTLWILVIAYVVRSLPYGTRFTNAGLMQVHRELQEAGMVSGARLRTIFVHIIMPIMRPALIGGFLYIFVISVKVFSIAAILGSPESRVIAVQIYQLWYEGTLGQLSALAIIMIAAISVLTLLGGKSRMGQMAF